MAAHQAKEDTVRLLAHMGARLLDGDGDGFWMSYQDDDTHARMAAYWQSVIDAGGDEPTAQSLRTRRTMMVEGGMHYSRQSVFDTRYEVVRLAVLVTQGRAAATDAAHRAIARLVAEMPMELVRVVLEML